MICLLFGDNTFAISEQKNLVTQEYLSTNDPFGLEQLDGQDLSVPRLRDSILQLPFLVNKKLVVLVNPFADKVIVEALTNLIDSIPEDIDLVMIEQKPDKRTKLYKLLQSKKYTKEFLPKKGSELQKWAIDYALKQGATISTPDSTYLINRVGDDQMLLAREIEKLSYAPTILRQDIDDLTDPTLSSSVFDLLDLAFTGDTKRALVMYEELIANKTDPNEIMGLIAWQLHVFALIKYSGQTLSADIASKTGVHPFVVGKALKVTGRLTAGQIKDIVSKALLADEKIKTGKADADDVLRVLLLDLSKV